MSARAPSCFKLRCTVRRYHDKDAWLVHHEASPYKTLITWFEGSGIKLTRTIDRFQETSIGFWAR